VSRLGLGVAALCFALLAFAAAPSIHALDSAELAAAGVRLGVSHPPGQPVHALLVKALALLPLGDAGFRANLVSALAAALAAGLLAAAAQRTGARSLVAGAIGLAVGWSGPAVENGTRAEVYTPALALVTAALLAGTAAGSGDRRPAAAMGACAGLAFGLHPTAAIAIGAAYLASSPKDLRGHLRFALAALLGLVPLAHVLVRGPRDPFPLWDTPRTVADAVAFFTAAGYAGNFDFASAPRGLVDAAWIAVRGTGGVLAAIAVAGAILRRDRTAGALGAAFLAALLPVAPAAFFPDNPDVWGYALPAIAILAIAAARSAGRLGAGMAIAILGACLLLGGAGRGVRPRSRLVEARVEEVLESLPPRAVLVAESDLSVGALSFLQSARYARPDVAWIGSGIAGQRAPWPRIRRQSPRFAPLPALAPVPGDPRDRAVIALAALARGQVPCFTEDRRLLPRGREWAGWVELGPGDPRARTRWARLRREARGDEAAEEGIRSAMLGVSVVLAAQDEPRAAGRALLVGLPRPRSELRQLVHRLPVHGRLLRPVADAELRRRFGPDEGKLERALARLAFGVGRSADAVTLLERAYRNGSDEAGAQLALFAIAEGRADDARAIVRSLVDRDPEVDGPLARLIERAGSGTPGPPRDR